jgi:hypothetical protein
MLAISNDQLAMRYQLAISQEAAFNRQWLTANSSQFANGQSLILSGRLR